VWNFQNTNLLALIDWRSHTAYQGCQILLGTYNIPTWKKINKITTIPIYQMAINQTNILHCKALQNIYPNCAFWSENIPSGNPCAYLPGWRNVQSVESPSSLDNVNCCNNGQILFLFVFLIRGGNCAHERNCESREKRESYNRRTYNMFYYIMPTYIKCR
jgi:hypothetical protein